MKKIFTQTISFTLALLLFAGISIIYAWTEPTQAPPSGNVAAPLNVSSVSQYKSGALGVGGVFHGYSTGIFDGNVGIGTASPSQKLDVAGYINGQTGLCIGSDCRNAWPTTNPGTSVTDGASSGDYNGDAHGRWVWGDWFSTSINTPRAGGYVIAFATAGCSGDDGGGMVVNYDGADGNVAWIVGGGSCARNAVSIGVFPAGSAGSHTLKVRAAVASGSGSDDAISNGRIQAFWLP